MILAAVAPFLDWAGPTSAIIIGLYMLIFIVLAIALSAAGAFLAYWINKQIGVIKLLRPTIDSVNKTTEAAKKGVAPTQYQNRIISTIAEGPVQVQKIDKQVEQYADRAVNVAIEVQARMQQVETVAKAFFLPGLARREALQAAKEKGASDGQLSQADRERLAPELPAAPARDGHQPKVIAAPQSRKDVALR